MPPTKLKVADGSVPEESDTVAQMAADVEARTADYPEGAPGVPPGSEAAADAPRRRLRGARAHSG
jgi:hypothetical protein